MSVGKVVTEPELVERSLRLETSLANANMSEFCESKIGGCANAEDQQVWRFIKANFGDNPRLEFLDLLGYDPDDVAKKVEDGCGVKVRPPTPPPDGGDGAVNDAAERLDQLDTTADKEGAFDAIASQHQGRRYIIAVKSGRLLGLQFSLRAFFAFV